MYFTPPVKTNAKRKARKGFSLVELVVVVLIIAILALAVFAGGSAVIKKSQISRTTSDLHNFSVAVEATLNENPGVANIANDADSATSTDIADIATALGNNLPADYTLTKVTAALTGNITMGAPASDTFEVYESSKTDAWDNHYYVIFDCADRHGAGNSDFYITVVSAGPNAKTALDGSIESDDVFLLAQYENGDVSAVTYTAGNTGLNTWDTTGNTLKALTPADAKYTGATNGPVNF